MSKQLLFSNSRINIIACFMVLLLTIMVSAQEETSNYEITIIPYLWAANVDVDNTLGNVTVPMNASFGDLWKVLEFAGQAHFEIKKNKSGMGLDIIYMKLSGEKTLLEKTQVRTEALFEHSSSVIELFTFHQLYESDRTWWQVLGGLRFLSFNSELDVVSGPVAPSGEYDEAWVDPFVGIRLKGRIADKLYVVNRADFGGFGLGSKFAWTFGLNFAYQLTEEIGIGAGVKHLNFDYDNDREGSTAFFAYEGSWSGLQLGAVFNFK
jgi:hypothetical protein